MTRTSQAVGASFESLLERHHAHALDLGIVPCKIEHNQAQSRVVHGRLIYTKPGISDYSGIIHGRFGLNTCAPLAVEAKSVKGDRLALSAVEPLQAKYLEAVARAGGLALLAVQFREAGVMAAIPWADVPWKISRSAESLSVGDVKRVWIFEESGCYLEDYCEKLLRKPPVQARRVFPRE